MWGIYKDWLFSFYPAYFALQDSYKSQHVRSLISVHTSFHLSAWGTPQKTRWDLYVINTELLPSFPPNICHTGGSKLPPFHSVTRGNQPPSPVLIWGANQPLCVSSGLTWHTPTCPLQLSFCPLVIRCCTQADVYAGKWWAVWPSQIKSTGRQ